MYDRKPCFRLPIFKKRLHTDTAAQNFWPIYLENNFREQKKDKHYVTGKRDTFAIVLFFFTLPRCFMEKWTKQFNPNLSHTCGSPDSTLLVINFALNIWTQNSIPLSIKENYRPG